MADPEAVENRAPDGRWLLCIAFANAVRRLVDAFVELHPTQLIDLLVQQLRTGALRMGVEVTDVRPDDEGRPRDGGRWEPAVKGRCGGSRRRHRSVNPRQTSP